MKLKCNLCLESPVIDTEDFECDENNALILCPSCGLDLAYADEDLLSGRLSWKATWQSGGYNNYNKNGKPVLIWSK